MVRKKLRDESRTFNRRSTLFVQLFRRRTFEMENCFSSTISRSACIHTLYNYFFLKPMENILFKRYHSFTPQTSFNIIKSICCCNFNYFFGIAFCSKERIYNYLRCIAHTVTQWTEYNGLSLTRKVL